MTPNTDVLAYFRDTFERLAAEVRDEDDKLANRYLDRRDDVISYFRDGPDEKLVRQLAELDDGTGELFTTDHGKRELRRSIYFRGDAAELLQHLLGWERYARDESGWDEPPPVTYEPTA